MILVTGAAGKTGRRVLEQLSQLSEPVRALVHRPEYEAVVLRAGADQVVIGDLRDKRAVEEALEGVRVVYHIPPNMHPDELAIGASLIQVARQTGVDHFVYHSVLHPQVEAMPHHWQKLRVEESLFTSGLAFTILQPAAYMQNILAQWETIVERGFFQMPYGETTRLSVVDLQDVAEVARVVLTQEGHRGATYELCGTGALSQEQVAEQISAVLGKEIRADTISIESWSRQAKSSGLGEYAISTLIDMFRYYDSYGFVGNPSVLKCILGREPRDLEDVILRECTW